MRSTFQTSSSYQSSSTNQQGATQSTQRGNFGGADLQAERDLFLRYATSGDAIVVSGSSDYGIIAALKDAITKLKTDYFSRSGVITIRNE